MSWLLLCGAVVSEVASTLSLRVAAGGRRAWYVPVIIGYVIAFACFQGASRFRDAARRGLRGVGRRRDRPDRPGSPACSSRRR